MKTNAQAVRMPGVKMTVNIVFESTDDAWNFLNGISENLDEIPEPGTRERLRALHAEMRAALELVQ